MDLPKFLPKLFTSSGSSRAEYFFALNIDSDKVEGAIWGVEGKKLQIVSVAAARYHSEDELIEAANFALDEALADFQPEPEKVLFGVPDAWMQDEELKTDNLKFLKKLVKELDITPMAYVSTINAISHFLQKQQGVPVTAVLVKIADHLVVTVIKGGKVLGSKSQKRLDNLAEGVEKALLEFTNVEVLPSKILLYGAGDLEKLKDELSAYSWMSQLPFLHLPKVDILDSQVGIKSLCFAGGIEVEPDISCKLTEIIPARKQRDLRGMVPKPTLGEGQVKETLGNIGFIKGDIGKALSPYEGTEMAEEIETEEFPEVEDSGLADREIVNPRLSRGKLDLSFLSVFKALPVKILALILIGVLLSAGALLFVHKAKVKVFIDMQVLERSSQVVADPSASQVDEGNKKIPGKIIDTEVTGTAKGQATGKKLIGDPARGTVMIYNKTYAPKTFSAGTTLTGPGGLTFKLDSKVTIASQSAVEGGISFGKGTANVTAANIGSDGNLPAGKELTVGGGLDKELDVKVDQAFAGGVSREVTIMTADDQKKLLANLSADLRKKAKDDLQSKLTGDMKILEESLSEQITKKTYSKEVNDQALEFSLSVTAKYKGTAYNEGDLRAIVSKLVETNVPAEYELDLSRTETQAEVSKVEKDGKLIFLAKFRAKLMPKLDHNKIKGDIAGKTPEDAVVKLREISNVIGSNIEIHPSLPASLQRLPFLSRNIELEVIAK